MLCGHLSGKASARLVNGFQGKSCVVCVCFGCVILVCRRLCFYVRTFHGVLSACVCSIWLSCLFYFQRKLDHSQWIDLNVDHVSFAFVLGV